jgi:hypothetical protein
MKCLGAEEDNDAALLPFLGFTTSNSLDLFFAAAGASLSDLPT